MVENIVSNLTNVRVAIVVSTTIIVAISVYMVFKTRGIMISSGTAGRINNKILRQIGKVIYKQEREYGRKYDIGRIKNNSVTIKLYRFLNDLTIDLGLKKKGVTPYTLLFIVIALALATSVLLSFILAGNASTIIPTFPMITFLLSGFLYTKANVEHEKRINDIITAENVIASNISKGIRNAVKKNLSLIPKRLEQEYITFLNNLDDNMYIVTALLELNNSLGSYSTEFIKNCISFEIEQDDGVEGLFRDLVMINGLKAKMRIKMRQRADVVKTKFIISITAIGLALAWSIFGYANTRAVYFGSILGVILILMDMAIFIGEFVYITYLMAKEI